MRGARGLESPGLVMKVHGRRAVVLVDSRFVRMRAMEGWNPGDRIWVRRDRVDVGERLHRAWAAAAAVAGAVAVVAMGGAVAASVPVAVVSVDVAPSVQLAVNHWGRVVQVTAMDRDGARLVAASGRIDHLPVTAAVGDLVETAIRLGFLPSPGALPGPAASSRPGSAAAATPPQSKGAIGSAVVVGGIRGSAGAGLAVVAARAQEAAYESPATVLIVVAPLRGAAQRVPAPVAREVSAAAGEVRQLLSRDRLPSAVVAVGRGRPADVRAADAQRVTLGDYILARDLALRGVKVDPKAFQDRPLYQVLAGAGIPRNVLVQALGVLEGAPIRAAAPIPTAAPTRAGPVASVEGAGPP